MRLDKYLAEMSYGTRNEVKKIIRSGSVTINGVQVLKPETRVDESSDIVYIGDERVSYSRYVYYMLNKPAGCVSAVKDNVHKTVIDLLKENIGNNTRNGIFPAGRLDIDTEGLVLLTNDGALAHMLLSPHRHVDKAYYVVADGIITENSIKQLTDGIDIGDGTLTLPAQAENIKLCRLWELDEDVQDIIKSKNNADISQTPADRIYTSMELVLHEGRYHQVKRMVQAAGSQVLYLKRIRIGPLWLDKELLPGECRELSEEETSRLLRP
ncbi:MAG: rRNA pseudouridine synthase [Lachnospiraceae bacterium]|nr:rRNA pseudouridine synthase [Lachnospiraceae bacterium]